MFLEKQTRKNYLIELYCIQYHARTFLGTERKK